MPYGKGAKTVPKIGVPVILKFSKQPRVLENWSDLEKIPELKLNKIQYTHRNFKLSFTIHPRNE